MTQNIPDCAICMMLLGDAYVLVYVKFTVKYIIHTFVTYFKGGNFDEALDKFERAYILGELELALKV